MGFQGAAEIEIGDEYRIATKTPQVAATRRFRYNRPMDVWQHHLVRVGLLGQVGRFTSVDGTRYRRGAEVVCRTARGLEVGEVLAHTAPVTGADADGSLLRPLGIEDRLLIARLEKNRQEALQACEALLAAHEVDATLVDVEQLFDGGSIYFYFLGEVPPAAEPLMQSLTETYEAKAKIGDFAAAVEAGCGPDCGTDEAAGCGTGGCASCAVASVCKTSG